MKLRARAPHENIVISKLLRKRFLTCRFHNQCFLNLSHLSGVPQIILTQVRLSSQAYHAYQFIILELPQSGKSESLNVSTCLGNQFLDQNFKTSKGILKISLLHYITFPFSVLPQHMFSVLLIKSVPILWYFGFPCTVGHGTTWSMFTSYPPGSYELLSGQR